MGRCKSRRVGGYEGRRVSGFGSKRVIGQNYGRLGERKGPIGECPYIGRVGGWDSRIERERVGEYDCVSVEEWDV